MVWVQIETSEGWGCSLCNWIVATPELETTVAALRYNRTAQLAFDAHECHRNGNGTFSVVRNKEDSRFAA
jgi:hypothetical protein